MSSIKKMSKFDETYVILINFDICLKISKKLSFVIYLKFYKIISIEFMIALAGVQNSWETDASISH